MRANRSILAVCLGGALMIHSGVTEAAQTKAQQQCTAAYHGALAKLSKTAGKVTLACIVFGAKGKLFGTVSDCLAMSSPSFDKVLAKSEEKIRAKCDGLDDDGIARTPSFGMPGDPSALSAAAGVLEALPSVLGQTIDDDLDASLVDFGANKPLAQCQIDVVKRQLGCLDTYLKEFRKCAKSGLKGNARDGIAPFESDEDLASCIGSDAKGKIAKACDGKISAAYSKCEAKGVDVALATPSCTTTGPTPEACAAASAVCGGCNAASLASAIDPAACLATCDTL